VCQMASLNLFIWFRAHATGFAIFQIVLNIPQLIPIELFASNILNTM
jgi:hypothetical protein